MEIASTFIAKTWQRKHINSSAKLLLLEYLFEVEKVHRVNFTIHAQNSVSQKALQSIGAQKIADITVKRHMPEWQKQHYIKFSFSKKYWQNHKKRLKKELAQKIA